MSCFDLAHEIGADVRALGEDAAAEAREDRDQRAAEGEADQRMQRVVGVAGQPHHDAVVAGDAEQAEADDQHAGDRAAAEGDLQRGVQADARRMRGAHVRAHRDVHADVAGGAGEDRADREADRRVPVEREAEDDEQHHADDRDRRVLPVQVGAGALLDRRGDFLHACVACGLRDDPPCHENAVEHGDDAGRDREPERSLHRHEMTPLETVNYTVKSVASRLRTRVPLSFT